MATVTAGATPLSAAAAAVGAAADPTTVSAVGPTSSASSMASSTLFLPWWTTVLLRLVQRRPWLHRVAGRSLLDRRRAGGAVLEAFVLEMLALSYSIATINVHSANPLDHLVHRHTYRVTRGALLAIGRPDGRLNAWPRPRVPSASPSTRRRRSRTGASRARRSRSATTRSPCRSQRAARSRCRRCVRPSFAKSPSSDNPSHARAASSTTSTSHCTTSPSPSRRCLGL